jgi:Tol biopolymer transport system component
MEFNIGNIRRAGMKRIYYLFFGIFILLGCNPCDPVPNDNPEQVIYLNIFDGNSYSVITTDESGNKMELVIDSAVIYSEPDVNGSVVYSREGQIYKFIPGKDPIPLKTDLFNPTEPVISPDGKYIAFRAEDNELYVLGEDLTTLYNITAGLTKGFSPVFSPDSKYLSYYKGDIKGPTLEVRQVNDLFLEPVYVKQMSAIDTLSSISWSQNGLLSFYSSTDAAYCIYIVNPAENGEEEIKISSFNISSLQITPNGDSLVIRNSNDGKVFIRNVKGEPYYRRVGDNSGGFISKGDIKISGDGKYLMIMNKMGSFENLIALNLRNNKQSIITSNAAKWFFGRNK